jgi:hypothetical protein
MATLLSQVHVLWLHYIYQSVIWHQVDKYYLPLLESNLPYLNFYLLKGQLNILKKVATATTTPDLVSIPLTA